MINCKEFSRTSSDYLDGEISNTRRLSMFLHQLMCRHCRAFLTQLGATMRMIRQEPPASEDEIDQVLSVLGKSEKE